VLASEAYTRAETEVALSAEGYNLVGTLRGVGYYERNYPNDPYGEELALDWSLGKYEWEDIKKQLVYYGIDPDPVHESLKRQN